MKIIAHTSTGYMAEVQPEELAAITGKHTDNQHDSRYRYIDPHQRSHAIGTEFKVNDTWKHLQVLLQNEGRRHNIAESLRAAATLIEHTPSPIVIPAATESQPAQA